MPRHIETRTQAMTFLEREGERLSADLREIKMQGWRRSLWYDDTGLEWINPSPNIRNLTQAILYPGVGIMGCDNGARDPGGDERIGARRRFAVMAARLKAHVGRGAARLGTCA